MLARELNKDNQQHENNNQAPAEVEAKNAPKAEIDYEHFAALDIAIGTIVSVEVVEGADKLLKLMVDVGEGSYRQIVSGIREYFANPQFLVGTQAPFLLNLAPRTIRGVESRGMILAASKKETLALLNPHLHVPTGTRVK